ncbi:MAG TPA: helix-turn-helix domain-containing protein [Chitinophagaceae bacterium]|nr:helix-turn-helix domain-containing protein [Chitinophagaceae bacterium]
MKKVSLIIYEDVVLSAISGVLDLMNGANRHLQECGRTPAFTVELVSEKDAEVSLRAPALFSGCKTLDEINHTDLIIVPAFFNAPSETILRKNAGIVEWIKDMHLRGAEVASLCLGSYFLAEAGLLNGKMATSHWAAVDDMRRRYPKVNMLSDKVITDQQGVYTSGGAFSSLNLVLYLIEKFCGRETALWTSKFFSIDMDRVSQAHFAVFQSQRRHEDEGVLKAQAFIEEHYHKDITVEQIAQHVNMSRRNFIRRFKSATQNTPLEYLQRVRIEAAKKALEKNSENIGSLMYDAGYNDVKTFRSVFKRITGLTPKDYRRKYSRAGMETV